MSAQVSEVKAFKSIDDSVHDTYLKAHHRNVRVLCERLLGAGGDDSVGERIAEEAASLLYGRLIHPHNLRVKDSLLKLAKELE